MRPARNRSLSNGSDFTRIVSGRDGFEFDPIDNHPATPGTQPEAEDCVVARRGCDQLALAIYPLAAYPRESARTVSRKAARLLEKPTTTVSPGSRATSGMRRPLIASASKRPAKRYPSTMRG